MLNLCKQKPTICKAILSISILVFFAPWVHSQTIWSQIGPKNPALDISNFDPNTSGSGLVSRVMFEPGHNGSTKKRLFAWSYSGLWLSESGLGNDWQNMNTDKLGDPSFSAIAIDPNNRNHIIGTTGTLSAVKFHSIQHLFEYKYSTGFWNGNYNTVTHEWDWERIPGCCFKNSLSDPPIAADVFFAHSNHRLMTNICINENNSNEIICIVDEIINPTTPNETFNSYIYKSVDGGITWIRKLQLLDFFLKDILCVNGNVFTSGIRASSNTSSDVFFKSTNFGDTWKLDYASDDLANGNPIFIDFFKNYKYYNAAYSASTPAYIYLTGFTGVSCQTLKIDLSLSPNRAQLLLTSTGFSLYNDNGHSDAFDINPNDANKFLYGGWRMGFAKYSSTGFSSGFPKYYGGFNPDFHQDIRDVIFYPNASLNSNTPDINNCIVATDGGIYKGLYDAISESYSFTNISNGLEILNCTDISCSQNASGDDVMINTWDNGTYKLLPNGKWEHSGNEGREVTKNPESTSKYYYEWYPSNSISEGYSTNLYHAVSKAVYNPQNSRQLFLIDNSSIPSVIRATEDNYGNLTETGLGVSDNDLTAIDVCAADPNVIVVAKFFRLTNSLGRLFKTTDGGNSWNFIDVPFSGGLNEITDLVISASNPNKIWVSDYSNKIAFTDDGGIHWNTQTLPSHIKAIYSLFYLRGSNDMVFAGTSSGLYVFNASTNQWVDYNYAFSSTGVYLPNSLITGIDYNYNTQTMYISTFGRGVWKGNVSCEVIQSNEVLITGDVTWNYPLSVNNNIHLLPGSTLHISNTLRMGQNKTIIVDPGAKLLVHGGTISSICPNKDWSGIVAQGVSGGTQNTNIQSLVVLNQGALIENASIGVFSFDGGIVRTTDATFKNCDIGIYFSSPSRYSSKSVIRTSHFFNSQLINTTSKPWNGGIFITNVDGISIEGCSFECSLSQASTTASGGAQPISRGIGINVMNASVKIVRAPGLSANSTPGCNPPTGPVNSFIQLHEGIRANNLASAGPLDIFECSFLNCGVGIDLTNTDGSRIFKNDIEMSDIWSDINLSPNGGSVYLGIQVTEMNDFIMEANYIKFKQDNLKQFIGVNIIGNASFVPSYQSYIFSNRIESFIGNNSITDLTGIKTTNNCRGMDFWCNKLYGLSTGIALQGVHDNQSEIPGFPVIPRCADNEFFNFSPTKQKLVGNKLMVGFNYYYDLTNPAATVTTSFKDNIIALPIAPSNGLCSAAAAATDYYCNSGKGLLVPGTPVGDPVVDEEDLPPLANQSKRIIIPEINAQPSPASEKVTFSFRNFTRPDGAAFINILNNEGVSLHVINIANALQDVVWDVTGLPPGLYTVSVVNVYGENAKTKLMVIH